MISPSLVKLSEREFYKLLVFLSQLALLQPSAKSPCIFPLHTLYLLHSSLAFDTLNNLHPVK